MDFIAVIGGGISGCTAADRLFEAGKKVLLIEKTDRLGGNIANYGCKADSECVKDNLCLVQGIFDRIANNRDIMISYDSNIVSISGKAGNYSLEVRKGNEYIVYDDIRAIVLATGNINFSKKETGTVQWQKDERVIWASELEELLYKRSSVLELGKDIKSAVFIQCNGSRSVLDKADYCSRVCCGYSYRMARALKHFYPGLSVTMLYMDVQEAGYMQELSFEKLDKQGIGYKLCKPVSIMRTGNQINIEYEDRAEGCMKNLESDLVVLSEGIHPGSDNEKMAEIFNLQLDRKGFLENIEDETDVGIYLAGTVKGPRDIASSINDAARVSNLIIEKC